MLTIASSPQFLEADRMARYLRHRGVLATVHEYRPPYRGSAVTRLHHAFDVIIAYDEDAELAKSVLRHLPEHQPPEAGWEAQLAPDLSVLAPELAPPCPACGAQLPLDASLRTCPACSAPVDVAELIAERHGPETLAHCYGTSHAEFPLDEAAIRNARLNCPCGYSLSGLPLRGSCPECGRGFDKAEIFA